MVKIQLKRQGLPFGVVKSKELASPEQFSMSLLAHSISLVEAVDELVGRAAYADKIDILDHQTRTALQVLNNFSHRALLADEVGLGKTIEAGIIIKEYLVRKLIKKILILVPAPLKFQWQEEMRSKFDEEFVIADSPDVYRDEDRVIASIDTAKTPRHLKVVQDVWWDMVVVDEAHKLKNPQTQNYKLVKGLKKDRALMLTATPLQNNIFELWALLDLLHPGFLGTRSKFADSFIADNAGLRVKNNDLLQSKLSKIMIRNLRRDTGIKFVDRQVKTHLLEYSKDEMDFYTDAVGFVRRQYQEIRKAEEFKEGGDVEEASQLSEAELKAMALKYRQKGLLTFTLIMLTRQITSSLKTGVEALKRYRDTIRDEKKGAMLDMIIRKGELLKKDKKVDYLLSLLKKVKDKVVLFTTFVHTQKTLEMELQLAGFSTVLFNGKMTPEEKEDAIRQFREDKQILICTDAGSEGRNLQFAHILINFDLPWNPMRVEQRIGRVHRLGQKRDVFIHNLAIKHTIEGYILNRLYEKIDLFRVSIGEMDLILSQLKRKGSMEGNIFESVMKEDYTLGEDLEDAKKSAESVKQFDNDVFGWGGKGGS